MKDKLRGLVEFLDKGKSWVPLFLRLAIGMTFVVHGWGKVQQGLFTFPHAANMPLGSILGPLVPLTEFAGGIALIAGLTTRIWAFMQCWVMVYAIAFVHGSQGFKLHVADGHPAGWEWQALILAGCITIVISGPGVLSLDHILRKKVLAKSWVNPFEASVDS